MDRLFEVEQLRDVERECGFRYPPDFWTIVQDLDEMAATPGFAKVFPQARSPKACDIAAAWDNLGMPTSLVPFLCDQQRAHVDYYCCGRIGDGETMVQVFADHAVVADWPSFEAFLSWMRQRCEAEHA